MARTVWLTQREVCEELGVARSTFSQWRAAGKAPRMHRMPNGSLKCRREDLDQWYDHLEVA